MFRLINLWKILCGLVLYEFATLQFGKSSSSSAATTNTTNNIDKRLVVSEGTGMSFDNSSGNAINITDGGAVSNALAFAGGSVSNVLSFALEASKSANELSAEQTNTAKEIQLDLIDLQKSGGEMQYKSFQQALGFAEAANDRQTDIFRDVLGFAADTATGAAKAFDSAAAQAVGAYSTAAEINTGSRFLVMGGLVIAGIVAFAALRK